jgi:hypothetical protein
VLLLVVFFLALPNTFSTNRKMQLVYGVEQ